jgi:hypothetical protein
MTQKEKRATEAFKFLVLLPFDASAKRLRDAINTTIREARAEPIFLDQIGRGAVWVDEVSQLIRSLTPLRAGAVVVLSHCPAPAQSPGICPGVLQCPAYTAGGDSRKPVTCGPPRYPPAKPRGALERNRRPRCV